MDANTKEVLTALIGLLGTAVSAVAAVYSFKANQHSKRNGLAIEENTEVTKDAAHAARQTRSEVAEVPQKTVQAVINLSSPPASVN